MHREIKGKLLEYAANINYKKYSTAQKRVQIALRKLQSYRFNYETDLLEILIELFNLNIKTKNDEIDN